MSNLMFADYYKFAALATASYVRMGGLPLDGAAFANEAANAQRQAGGRLPLALATALFNPASTNALRWNVLSYYGGDIPAGADPIAAADKSGFGANVEDDVLFGEAGSDILIGGSGKDFLHGDPASVDWRKWQFGGTTL